MRRRFLSDEQIQGVCEALLSAQRKVGQVEVRAQLRAQFGAVGRASRVSAILCQTKQSFDAVPRAGDLEPRESETEDVKALKAALNEALQRASVAEERERVHQDFYARQYADKLVELEKLRQEILSTTRGVPSEQYLRIYQRAAYFRERLAQYEAVEPLLPYGSAKKGGQ
jgi:hypothetical protein